MMGIGLKVMFALIFILAENRTALVPLACYLVVLPLFLVCREKTTIFHNEEKAMKQNILVQTVNDAVSNFRLIADFQMRPHTVDTYSESIDNFQDSECHACAVMTNNMYMAPWLTLTIIGVWMVYGSFEVESVGGHLSLGLFLATINVFKEIGGEMQEIYNEAMEIQASFGPLKKICYYMNLETDQLDRMRVNRGRRKSAKIHDKGGLVKANGGEDQFAIDHVELRLDALTFSYPGSSEIQKDLFTEISCSFSQGKLFCIVGPSHEGKGTMLKLLGQVLLPHSGQGSIFIPSHLRILHVTQNDCLLNTSFLHNVILGADLTKVGGKERIRKICERVGFKQDVLSHLDESSNMRSWAKRFSHTDFSRLNLARALCMNPECLVMHKPALVFDEADVKVVLGLIRAHVDERGIELDASARRLRRPRTVFFTSSRMAGVQQADAVYKMSMNGLTQVDKSSVRNWDFDEDRL